MLLGRQFARSYLPPRFHIYCVIVVLPCHILYLFVFFHSSPHFYTPFFIYILLASYYPATTHLSICLFHSFHRTSKLIHWPTLTVLTMVMVQKTFKPWYGMCQGSCVVSLEAFWALLFWSPIPSSCVTLSYILGLIKWEHCVGLRICRGFTGVHSRDNPCYVAWRNPA